MPNALRWEGAPVDEGLIIDLGTTLATAAVSAVGAEWDGSTNLDMLGWFELGTSDNTDLFAAAVTVSNSSLDLYRVVAPDGTNYENTPVTADIAEFGHLYVGSFPIASEIGNQPIVIGPFALPPMKQKYLIHNNATGQTMTAEWDVRLFTNNPEIQDSP
jgi:hypothetical protein